MGFKLTRKALDDLEEIAEFTTRRWGARQRNSYLKQIDDSFRRIAENHRLGQSCDYIREGYFKFVVGRHVIFYRLVDDSTVQIVRILHGNMDVSKHI